MIYDGRCPYCAGKLVEARVRRTRGIAVLDESGPEIKTKCSDCGRFIGYRDVVPAKRKGPAEDQDAIWEG